MAVHFKFRSAVAFDSIQVDGNGITVGNLKDKIVEQKNLGRSTNIDLVITNAESGEEYTEDTVLVPKNTSVIIKRVPAKRAKTTLLVNEPEDYSAEQQTPPPPVHKVTDMAHLAFTSPLDELYDMDDFGVDLYAVDESALTHVEADETSNGSAFLANSVTDEKRFAGESLVDGGYGMDASAKGLAKDRGLTYRSVPHVGYVCHRCGLPGHFIQHCSTNGDPAYNLKKWPRLRVNREDLSASLPVVSQSSNFGVKDADPLPPELQCSLCQTIFKEAVMIPCCQYSFCDTCARQYLLEKGSCPQCGSDKVKVGDVLPNVALRQAIERFMSVHPDTAAPIEGADVDSATKAAPPTQLQKMTSDKELTSMVVKGNPHDLPAVDDSVCESAIGSKEKVAHDANKTVALVGEVSYVGRKKKRPFSRSPCISEIVSEHMAGKSRKVNRYCFVCGSPDHIARNCASNAGDNTTCFPTQRGLFRPFAPVPPGATNSFGQEMFWPGPMPYGAPGLPVGPYGPMPYTAPALPVTPYGVSSFAPPMYPNPQMPGFLSGRMVTPTDRPLSREEFMELQERERRRRLAQERLEREISEERPLSEAGNEQFSSSSPEHSSFRKQRPAADRSQGSLRRHDNDLHFLKEKGSAKSNLKRSKKHATERVDELMAPCRNDEEVDEDLAFDDFRFAMRSQRFQCVTKKANKVYNYSPHLDHEEGQSPQLWGLKEEGQSKLGKHTGLGRLDGIPFEKREHKSYVKHDGTRVSEAGAEEMLRVSRHRSKKAALEGPRALYSSQSLDAPETNDMHTHYGLVSDDGNSSFEAVKNPNAWKHQKESELEMIEGVSVEGVKKRRKHKRRKVEGSKDVLMENVLMEPTDRKSSKRHKSHHTSFVVNETSIELPPPVLDDIEESRWRMYDGLGDSLEDANISHEERSSKHKHRRSSKSALQE